MQEGTIGRRYARALSLALGGAPESELKAVEAELSGLGALLDRRTGQADFRQAMVNPSFSPEQRKKVLADIAKAHSFQETTSVFLQLLVEKDRLPQLPAIAHAFRDEVDARIGRVRAVLTTAKTLDAASLAEIVRALEKKLGKTVLPDVQVDPSVISGVQARIGGLVYDATVRSQLNRLREEFHIQ